MHMLLASKESPAASAQANPACALSIFQNLSARALLFPFLPFLKFTLWDELGIQ